MKKFTGILFVICAVKTIVAAQDFFPKGSVDDFEQKWYGTHLAAMREPVLAPNPTNNGYFAFRVLYLPTWGHPVSVRYWGSGTNFFRRSVVLSGAGGYEPGTIKKESLAEVRREEIDQLLASLDKINFWKVAPKDDVQGLDGSELILEAVRKSEHKVVVRWTPGYDAKNRNLEAVVDFYHELFKRLELLENSASDKLKPEK